MTLEDIRQHDSQNMHALIAAFPEHFRRARAIAAEAPVEASLEGVRHVVIAGMGGSAIGGDLLRSLAAAEASLPVSVVRGYTLPAYAGRDSLVIISSFSGNTEETLTIFDEARRREAAVVCVASGGEALRRAQAAGVSHIVIPGGMPPRAALGYSFGALFALAQRIGLLRTSEEDVAETDALLAQMAEGMAALRDEEPLRIAEALRERLPVVYAEAALLEAAATRWACQFHENSKRLAYVNRFPELNHNEIMGWEDGGALPSQLGVVVLRDAEDHPRVQRRIDATRSIVEERAGCWIEVQSRGRSRLARLLSTVHLGDWASLHLAAARGVDPTPIGFIDRLKDAL